MARGGHDDAGHVLVAAGDRDVGVVVLGAGYGFDGVGDDFTRLEGEAHSWGLLEGSFVGNGGWGLWHTFAAHCDGIGYTDCVELPGQHVLLDHRCFDNLSQVMYWRETSLAGF